MLLFFYFQSPVQTIENKLQNIKIQSNSNEEMDTSPETIADETVVISNQAESLNNTFVLKQNADIANNKRQATTTPHRSKPPIDTRCLTKSITKPAIQRKRVVLNNLKAGHVARNINQENLPLIMAATKTLADPILAKTVTKTKAITSNILSAKSGK